MVFRVVLLCAFAFLVGCGGGDNSQQAAATAEPAIPKHHYDAQALKKLRDAWNDSSGDVLLSGDSIHGQILTLLSDPSYGGDSRDLPLQDVPSNADAVQPLPRDWTTTRDRMQDVVSAISEAHDGIKKWMNDGVLDDDTRQTLQGDADNIVSTMCTTLSSAREYYGADGGYPNDISFSLISDKGDRPCMNVSMRRPYQTTMNRRGLATIAESTNEMPEANNEDAFLSDGTGFVLQSGQTVTVIGHRISDSQDFTLCQVHGGGGTGWVPCGWLSRQPARSDG